MNATTAPAAMLIPSPDALAHAANVRQFHPGPAGLEVVRGEIIGPVSAYYSATLQTVEVWPRHGYRRAYPAKVHTFAAEEGTTGPAALVAYCLANHRETALGDGSPCIVTLEPVDAIAAKVAADRAYDREFSPLPSAGQRARLARQ